VQAAFRGSTFQSSCASPVLQHLNDATVVTCYDGTQLTAIPGGGGFTPTMATGSAGCANSGASSWFVFFETYNFPELANARSDATQETTESCPEGRFSLRADPQDVASLTVANHASHSLFLVFLARSSLPADRFFVELDADSSADLRVSLDGVDAVLSPVNSGACSMTTTSNLGTNSFYGRALTIPASELNIPGCGGGCAGAYAGPANGTSTGCGAGSSSGQICAVACNPGFNLVGGTVR